MRSRRSSWSEELRTSHASRQLSAFSHQYNPIAARSLLKAECFSNELPRSARSRWQNSILVGLY
jgi:hypothetical protein